MLKYVNLTVDNYIVPQETSLIITLCDESNETGIPLFIRELQRIMDAYKDKVTCIMFEGADFKPSLITYWVNYVYKHGKDFKVGWISRGTTIPKCLIIQKMDYIYLQDDLYQRDYNSKDKSFEKSWYLNSHMTQNLNN